MQRAAPVASPQVGLGLLRFLAPAALEDGHRAQEDGVVAFETIEVDLRELGGRDVTLTNQGRQTMHREEGDLFLGCRQGTFPGLDLDRVALEQSAAVVPPEFFEQRAVAPRIGLELHCRRFAVAERHRW